MPREPAYKPDGLPLQFFEAGIYENDYVREGGVWLIKRLDYMMQWQADYEKGWSHTTAHLQPAMVPYPQNPLGPDVLLPAADVARRGRIGRMCPCISPSSLWCGAGRPALTLILSGSRVFMPAGRAEPLGSAATP